MDRNTLREMIYESLQTELHKKGHKDPKGRGILQDKELAVDESLNEAEMDKRFQKEWERNCKILINHLTHESRNKKYDRTESAEIRQWKDTVTDAYYIPAEMAEMLGVHEGLNEYGGSEYSKITAAKNFLYIDMGKFRDKLKDKKHLKAFDKAKKAFWDVIGPVAEEHHELYEGKLNEDKAMKAIIKAPKGTEIHGGGYSHFTKLGHNSWKNYKTKTLAHDKDVWSRFTGFRDFELKKGKVKYFGIGGHQFEGKLTERKLPKRFTVKTKQKIGDTLYNPGTYALKKKRWGGGIYLNMDNNQMLGVDVESIPQLTEGKPMFQDTPNEFAYLDFKKWAYKKRGMIKKALLKALGSRQDGTKMFIALCDMWKTWSKAHAKEWSYVHSTNVAKKDFGRALAVMMKKDGLILSKSGNKLTTITEAVYDKILKAVPDSYSYKKLAADIAKMIKDEYGSHNIKPFIKELSKLLKENKINEATNLWKHFDAKMKLQDTIMDLEYDMKMITKDIAQLHKDMEQEAEPEGGPKATKYGKEIDKKEKEYKKKKAEFKKLMAKLDKLEQF